MPRYSRKQKAALDTLMRDDVYRQALEIIEAEGLPGLTLDRLAKLIGISRATLYNYFDDRDAIVDFVEERTFLPLFETLAEIADGEAAPVAKLEAIAGEVFTGVYENRALVVALTPEKHCAANRARQTERRCSVLDTVRRVVEEGARSGVFRKLPPDLVAELFVATLSGLIDAMAHSGEFRMAEELVPTLMEVVVGGLKA
jgi:AcrR family transcriptional regulator